jgi:lysophospholipase L1-like esterase
MRWGRKTVAVLLSSVLSLLVAEVLLRTFAPRRTIEVLAGIYPAMFKESDYLPYRLRENYQGRLATAEFDTRIRINSLGYRGDEFGLAKGDAFRILVIGDSFTFGWGVEETEAYPYRLQQQLAKQYPSRRIEVINAGFAACYSPDTYYLYLEREGLALHPDLIVVGVFVGNDLDSDAAFEHEWTEQDAAGLPLAIQSRDSRVVGNRLLPREVPFRYRAPLLHRLHLFQAVADVWWAVKPRLMSVISEVAGPPVILHAAAAPEDERVPYIYRVNYADRTETVMKRVQSLFAGMKRLAAEAGVPLYFMLIPDQVQFADKAFDGLPAEIGKPQRLLAEFFEREGLLFVDLLPYLRERAAGSSLYFPGDLHWNARGHALAAERLASALVLRP